MSHSCFISFKMEDEEYKLSIQSDLGIDMIDRSVDVEIDASSDDAVIESIRRDYLGDSEVTIHLIGAFSSESRGAEEQKFIKRELQLSLYNGSVDAPTGDRNGILGLVLPTVTESVFRGSYTCDSCQLDHGLVDVAGTTVLEFSRNFFVEPLGAGRCAWGEQDRYCVLVGWDSFVQGPEAWIEAAAAKRESDIASKVVVFPS